MDKIWSHLEKNKNNQQLSDGQNRQYRYRVMAGSAGRFLIDYQENHLNFWGLP